jgi:hypothetical protein
VSSDDGIQRLPEALHVQGSAEVQDDGGVIERGVGLELGEKPETLLGEGERRRISRDPPRYLAGPPLEIGHDS